jgi:hypothetical protein
MASAGAFWAGNGPRFVQVSSDPRTGAGLAASPGTWATDGTYYYQAFGTGVNDWVKVRYFARTVVTGSAVQTITFSGLNGDLDIRYRIEGYTVNVANGASIVFKPNNVGTNQLIREDYGPANQDLSFLEFGAAFVSGSGGYSLITGDFDAKTGKPRKFQAQCLSISNGALAQRYNNFGVWTDTSTNVTSLVITSAGVNFAVGSIFCCYTPVTLEGSYL